MYQVWILGYNDDEIRSVNDYEQLEGTFEEYEKAEWFALNYPFSKPTLTPNAKVVVEKVIIEEDGSEYCEDILLESEL